MDDFKWGALATAAVAVEFMHKIFVQLKISPVDRIDIAFMISGIPIEDMAVLMHNLEIAAGDNITDVEVLMGIFMASLAYRNIYSVKTKEVLESISVQAQSFIKAVN